MKQLITVITSYRYHQPERCGDSMLVIPGGYEPAEYHEEFIDILEPECVEFDDSAYVGTGDLCLCVGDDECENCPNWDIARKGD